MEELIYNEETVEFSIYNANLELFPQEDEIQELDFYTDSPVVDSPPGDPRFGLL